MDKEGVVNTGLKRGRSAGLGRSSSRSNNNDKKRKFQKNLKEKQRRLVLSEKFGCLSKLISCSHKPDKAFVLTKAIAAIKALRKDNSELHREKERMKSEISKMTACLQRVQSLQQHPTNNPNPAIVTSITPAPETTKSSSARVATVRSVSNLGGPECVTVRQGHVLGSAGSTQGSTDSRQIPTDSVSVRRSSVPVPVPTDVVLAASSSPQTTSKLTPPIIFPLSLPPLHNEAFPSPPICIQQYQKSEDEIDVTIAVQPDLIGDGSLSLSSGCSTKPSVLVKLEKSDEKSTSKGNPLDGLSLLTQRANNDTEELNVFATANELFTMDSPNQLAQNPEDHCCPSPPPLSIAEIEPKFNLSDLHPPAVSPRTEQRKIQRDEDSLNFDFGLETSDLNLSAPSYSRTRSAPCFSWNFPPFQSLRGEAH